MNKKTVATISLLKKDKKQWLFSVVMKLNEDDRDLPSGCYRDLGRALKTFTLYANLDDSNIFEEDRLILGPYIYYDNEEVAGFVVFSLKDTVDEDSNVFAGNVRSAVNAASAIIHQEDGRMVRRRIKPIQQLMLVPIEDV